MTKPMIPLRTIEEAIRDGWMDRVRDELVTAVRILSTLHDEMAATLTRTQERCTQMLDVARAAKRFADAEHAHRESVSSGASSYQTAMDVIAAGKDIEREVAKLRALEGQLP